MKKGFLSPIYFVIAVYVLLAVIGFLELRCLANDTANQPYLLALNKAENTLAIIDPQNYNMIARAPTGEGPHEIITSSGRVDIGACAVRGADGMAWSWK